MSKVFFPFAAVLLLPVVSAVEDQGPPNPLKGLLSLFTPSPVEFLKEEYDGWQFRYGRFIFRPHRFIAEGVILGFILFYILTYLYGKWANRSRAEKWLRAHHELYASQFSSPGDEAGILDDGAQDLFQFSTGRRNIKSLHTVFTFLPRHDLLQLIATYAWTLYDLRYNPNDDVTLDFKLGTIGKDSSHATGFVWAIIDKEELNYIKNRRWDLTLTKTQDNQLVPKSSAVMSEVADVTDTILKNAAAAPLLKALGDPVIAKHFKSISITDLPAVRPQSPLHPDQKERHLILSLKVPSSSAHFADTVPLVKAAFGLADWIEGSKSIGFRPETTKKLKVAREDLDKELLKEANEEKNREAEESKRAAKKKAEEERIAKLSAEQQRKALEKEKKRALRKATTTKVRMG